MRYGRFGVLTFNVATVVAFVGCSQPRSARFDAPTIPSGKWRGRGTFVAYEAVGADRNDAASKPRFQDGVYDTSLDIARKTLFGREAIVVEIRSKRGKLFDSSDTETHIRMLLLRLKTTSHGNTLYGLGRLEFNPKEGQPDYQEREAEIRSRSSVPSASCVQIGPQTCLKVHYLLPDAANAWTFEDTFFFMGTSVFKTGSFAVTGKAARNGQKPKHKITQIYWAEQLAETR